MQGQYDDNSDFTPLKNDIDSIWNGLVGLNTAAATDKYSCMDFCVDITGYGFQLYTAIPNLSSSSYSKFDDDMVNIATSLFVAGVNQAASSRSGTITEADVELTTIRGEMDYTNEASGDDEITTTQATTTTAPDGTTSVSTTSTTEVTDPMLAFSGCITLYFPILWLFQTLFPGLFDFCPVFAEKFCSPFEATGAKCWSDHCDAVCRGDGVSDFNRPDDVDNDAADASGNKANAFAANGQLAANVGDNIGKFGCFDFCFEIHMTDDQFNSLSADQSRSFSFNQADLVALAEQVADDAVVAAVIQGPDVDTSNLGNATPGYQCLDPTVTDANQCLLSDTVATGFTVDPAGDGTASSIVAETLWNADTQNQLSGIDCSVNNGGCSHTCSGQGLNGACSCPNECWQLDVDQMTCNIHPDMVQLTCHPDRMEAHLAKCVVAGTDAYQLGNSVCTSETTVNGDAASTNPSNAAIIEHASCPDPTMGVDIDVNGDGVTDNGCLTFVVGLDECSMQVNADYDNNKLTFMQELVSTDFNANQQINALGQTGTKAMVNFDPRVSVDFTCEYTADYVTDSAEVTTNPDEVSNNLQSTGVFGYALKTVQPSMQDFNDLGNTWTDVHSTADGRDYMVGSTLYFQVCDQQELSNVYFSVPECTVYNDDMSESYQIITDHCTDPFVNTQRVGRYYDNAFQTWNADTDKAGFIPMPAGSTLDPTDLATNQCLTFSYTVFEFVSNADESADLKLSCKVKACEYSEANPDNMQTCIENTCAGGRKRRSLASEKYTTVTQTFRVTRPQE